jgi:hypothetical protein
VTFRYALRGKAGRQRVNVGAQVAPGQRLVVQAQRLRLRAAGASGARASRERSQQRLQRIHVDHRQGASGHGRTSWAPISDRVSSPGMVCGVSQAATRASWVNPRLDSIDELITALSPSAWAAATCC